MATSIFSMIIWEKNVAKMKKEKHRPDSDAAVKLSKLNSPNASRY